MKSWLRKKSNPKLEERLLKAAENGILEDLKECLAQNVNVNASDSSRGRTALHWASENGHLEMVQYLVRDSKADVEAKMNNGCTALQRVSWNGHLEVVRYLVRYGKANVNAKDNNGWTALHLSSQQGFLKVVQCLVRDGQVHVNAKDNNGWTALHLASQKGRLEVVQYLVRHGKARVNAVTTSKQMALQVARKFGKENVVNFLTDCIQSTANVIPKESSATDPSIESPMQKQLVPIEKNDSKKVNNDKEILTSRNELQRMINDPMAEPSCWGIKYLEECTGSFTSKVLGEGAFGKVYFGCDKVLGFQFAVKRVPMTVPDPDTLKTIVDSFRREVLVRCSSCILCRAFNRFLIVFLMPDKNRY
jgi:ankyrin repeat protein